MPCADGLFNKVPVLFCVRFIKRILDHNDIEGMICKGEGTS